MRGNRARVAFFLTAAGLAFATAAAAQPNTVQPPAPPSTVTQPALPPPAERTWLNKSLSPDARADALQAQMTRDEELTLVAGYFGVYYPKIPQAYRADMPNSAGYVPGVPRLGIPALRESDASLGVANGGHMRPKDTAVALPASILTAATWNSELAYAGGAMIGSEARNKGFNVMLAGGVNLTREPRGGRTFEYSGEDPLLAGVMTGEAIRGIQSQRIISTIKHFAVNDQETGRMTMSANISEAAMRESDLLAFEIAIEHGDPGSVMCAYNRINTVYACENDFLLNKVLKGDWNYKGFVMSDWGAVHSTVNAAMGGLDQESSRYSDKQDYFGDPLKDAVADGRVPEARLHNMVHRILRTMFAKGTFDYPPVKRPINTKADLDVARRDAEEGIVLLKNDKNLLPIDPLLHGSRRIAVIGGFADIGVLSGGGSSQVIPVGYNSMMEMLVGGAVSVVPGETPKFPNNAIVFHPPAPLTAIREEVPQQSRVMFYDGSDIAKAVALARVSDIVIVFAQQWMWESVDAADLSLHGNQNALIDAVASVNPRTVVVLETGEPVLMPWLNKVSAVLEAWYPGNRGANAIARILFGKVNPSGHLPVTFPQSESQLPRPVIPAHDLAPSQIVWNGARTQYDIDYIEGANIGYKWFAAKKLTPLFPFGYGLSYTSFEYDGLGANGGRTVSVNFEMKNTGKRAGKSLAQVYVTPPGGTPRLIGWSKVNLKPGEKRRIYLTADPRLLASFDEASHVWHIAAGNYTVTLGSSATDISASTVVHIDESTINP